MALKANLLEFNVNEWQGPDGPYQQQQLEKSHIRRRGLENPRRLRRLIHKLVSPVRRFGETAGIRPGHPVEWFLRELNFQWLQPHPYC